VPHSITEDQRIATPHGAGQAATMLNQGTDVGIKINIPKILPDAFKFCPKTPTFAARSKKRINNIFKHKINQGNEQLRIDGDFYPCAV
jgi:uncharacterized cupin superfamily protein